MIRDYQISWNDGKTWIDAKHHVYEDFFEYQGFISMETVTPDKVIWREPLHDGHVRALIEAQNTDWQNNSKECSETAYYLRCR